MRILLVSLFALNCFAQEVVLKEDHFFDTKFLSNYSLVAQRMIDEEEFKHVSFTCQDGIQLAGLARNKLDAPFWVICCAGFLPGAKEGLASLIRLLPPEANILFFDARGHGSSSGRFWTNLHRYGLKEYEDIAAAIKYIKDTSEYPTPIFLYGLCAGAYHAANTLLTIPQDDQIKGLIFDSGFTNPLNSMDIPGEYFKEKIAPGMCAWIYKENKEKAKTRYLSRFLGVFAVGFFRIISVCVHPFLKHKTEHLDLFAKIKKVPLPYPVLFIHAESDKFAKIQPIKKFAALVTDRDEWWIPDAQKESDPRPEHALNQIKCKHEYLIKLRAFIAKQLKRNS